jgi:hypothetical protein
MAKRIKDHSLESDLSSSTNPWCLMLSCLTILHINFEIVALPVLQIWQQDQRAIAEVLITMLAGSLVEDGGYNPIQAGTSIGTSKLSYWKEQMKVFVQKPWLTNGLRRLSEDLRQKDVVLRNFKKYMSYDFVGSVKISQRAVLELGQSLDRLDVAMQDAVNAIERAEAAKDGIEHADKESERILLAQLEFIDAVGTWLSQ